MQHPEHSAHGGAVSTIEPLPQQDAALRIFMVDDERSCGDVVARALNSLREVQFHFCQNPLHALTEALSFQPMLILLDLNMPELDGLTLLQELRLTPALQDVPVIVLSGEEMPETKRQAFELGAVDYLVKFPSQIELIARIRTHVQAFLHKQQRDQAYTDLAASNQQLAQALERVRQEEKKSEHLLLNLMPKAIADRLKRGETTIADHFDSVTVLFADVVNFSELARQLTPLALVQLLDALFSRLDLLASELGLEKIKTIGDAYLAVAGIPLKRGDHVEAVAEFALRVREDIAIYNQETGTKIQFRIGFNTGPVVAGVIGHSKLSYDLWGETVNLASRMESHGEPDMIQVTETAYQALKDKFQLQERGTIQIHGAGPMKTYWLIGRLREVR